MDQDGINRRVIITFRENLGAAGTIISDYGLMDCHFMLNGTVLVCNIAWTLVDVMRSDPRIQSVEEDGYYRFMERDTRILSGVNLEVAGELNTGNNFSIGGEPLRVALVDSGIEYGHPHIDYSLVGSGYDFIEGDAYPVDPVGHGTAMAGMLTSPLSSLYRPSGLTVYPLAVTDSEGRAFGSDMARAIAWSIENEMDIVVLGTGSQKENSLLETMCSEAFEAGILVVSPAGIWGDSAPDNDVAYPARYSGVITRETTLPAESYSVVA